MNTRSALTLRGFKATLAGTLLAASVLLSTLVAVPSSGASSRQLSAAPSTFCSTLFKFEKHPPSPLAGVTTNSYHAWAKQYLPFYQKLAASAPNSATKRALNDVVTVLKYQAGAKSFSKLQAYNLAHKSQLSKGAKALASAIVSCASSMY